MASDSYRLFRPTIQGWGCTLLGVPSAGLSGAPVCAGSVADLPCGSASGSWEIWGAGRGYEALCLSSSSSLAWTCACDDFGVPGAREQRHPALPGCSYIVTPTFCWLNKVIQQMEPEACEISTCGLLKKFPLPQSAPRKIFTTVKRCVVFTYSFNFSVSQFKPEWKPRYKKYARCLKIAKR